MKKTLILTIDLGNAPTWHAKAKSRQIVDWFNSVDLGESTNIVIFPAPGDTRLYWLEGNPDQVQDVRELEDIKDKLKPVLSAAIDLKVNLDDELKNEVNQLKAHRENNDKKR